jgi:DNA damage-inducible protein 1
MRRRLSVTVVESNVRVEEDLLSLDVGPDMTLGDVKAVIQSDTNLPPEALHFFYNGQQLRDDSKTLEQLGIGAGENLFMAVRDPRVVAQRRAAPQGNRAQRQLLGEIASASTRHRRGPDPETLRLNIIGDPRVRAAVRQQNPELADAADDPQRFRDVMSSIQRREDEETARREAEMAMLNADPFNPDNQRKIEEMIRQEAVMENLQNAMEHTPEGILLHLLSFSMLLMTCTISCGS